MSRLTAHCQLTELRTKYCKNGYKNIRNYYKEFISHFTQIVAQEIDYTVVFNLSRLITTIKIFEGGTRY